MQGHIEHRGSDCWRIAVDLGTDEAGKRQRISRTVHGSREEAQVERVRLLDELSRGEHATPSALTVGEYLTQWLAHAQVTTSPQTFRRYRQIVEHDLVPELGRIRLVDLSPIEIQSFLARSLARRCRNRDRMLSARTVGHFHRVLKRAMGQAAKWGLITTNPCDLVDSPRVRPVEMRALDEDALLALLEAVRGTRLYTPTLLAATSGMRRGELLALRWSDVDQETGNCQVVRALEQLPGGVGFKTPKTNRSRRTVLLPQMALSALRAHRAAQNQERLLLGAGYADGDLILARADGSPWPPAQFSSEFSRLVKKRGFAVRFHDLRHTHASQLLKAGVPVKVVSERLGHATTSITMDTYAHVLPNMQAEAVAKIDAALGK